jgi:hypothetical protein
LTLSDLGNLGDFLGGIGVILTLVYLASQIRQNTRVARLATLQQWVTTVATVNGAISQSGEFSRIYRAGAENAKSLEPDERLQFNMHLYQLFNTFESLFFQAEQGAIDQLFFEAKMETMRATLAQPGIRGWWDTFAAGNLDPRFREYVANYALR